MTDVTATEGDEIEEQDLLFNAYFEGEMSDEDRVSFEQRLAAESEFRRDYVQFTEVMGGVQLLQYQYAPDDFVDQVESTIRARSRGRFFGQAYLDKPRMQIEVVAIVMLIIMATTYLFFGAPADVEIQDLTVQDDPPTLKSP